jgi:ATPase subunit of ABC transporter with duplicated ATPase domains
LISTANITMQFGAKPLFENISVKFGDGNRYGLIGANGCGKSTFMKILDDSLAPTAGNVSITPNERVVTLSQDQFAFEQYSVIDTVIMGHEELWAVKQERDRIYGLPEMSEEDTLPGWNDPGGVRWGGHPYGRLHCSPGGPRTQAKG